MKIQNLEFSKKSSTSEIRSLNITGLFSVLPVPRLSQGLFWSSLHLFTYFLAKKVRHLAIFENSQASQTNTFFIAQDFGPSCECSLSSYLLLYSCPSKISILNYVIVCLNHQKVACCCCCCWYPIVGCRKVSELVTEMMHNNILLGYHLGHSIGRVFLFEQLERACVC